MIIPLRGRPYFKVIARTCHNGLAFQADDLTQVGGQKYAPDHHNTGTDFQPGEVSAGNFRRGAAIKTMSTAGERNRVTKIAERVTA